MRIIDLEQVDDCDVINWLEKKIPNLTVHQKECIKRDEIIRFAPFYFMKRKQKIDNILLRLSILFVPLVIFILMIGLPFRFIIKGRWGYNSKNMRWYTNWLHSCGL